MSLSRAMPALVVLVLLSGCATNPADDRLEGAVLASLRQHPALAADHITIHCENGVAYISGLVDTYLEYTEVAQVVRATPGVKQVVNNTAINNSRF